MKFDIRTEEDVIGTLLKFPQLIKNSMLCDGDFFSEHLKIAFRTLKTGGSIPMVAHSIGRLTPEPENYLMELVDGVVSPASLAASVRHLKSLAASRKVSEIIRNASGLLEDSESPLEVASKITDSLKEVALSALDLSHAGDETSFEDEVMSLMAANPWYEAGFGDKFKVRDSQLIALCARPGMGKSAGGLQVALELAKRKRFMVFSLEMTRPEWWERVVATHNAGYVKPERVGAEVAQKMVAETSRWIRQTRKLRVVDRSGLTAEDICSQATAAHLSEPGGLSGILIDYMSLVRFPRGMTKREGIEDACPRFKELAKELKIPVFVLQQLKREEKRESSRPDLMSLADSDQLGRDADQVWLIWADVDVMSAEYSRSLPVIITKEKCRGGAVGDARFTFEKFASRFTEGVEF